MWLQYCGPVSDKHSQNWQQICNRGTQMEDWVFVLNMLALLLDEESCWSQAIQGPGDWHNCFSPGITILCSCGEHYASPLPMALRALNLRDLKSKALSR